MDPVVTSRQQWWNRLGTEIYWRAIPRDGLACPEPGLVADKSAARGALDSAGATWANGLKPNQLPMLRTRLPLPYTFSRSSSRARLREISPIHICVIVRRLELRLISTSRPGSSRHKSASPASTTNHQFFIPLFASVSSTNITASLGSLSNLKLRRMSHIRKLASKSCAVMRLRDQRCPQVPSCMIRGRNSWPAVVSWYENEGGLDSRTTIWCSPSVFSRCDKTDGEIKGIPRRRSLKRRL